MKLAKKTLLLATAISALSTNAFAAPITYDGELLSGVTQTGSVSDPRSTGSDFWRFSATAGDSITLVARRIDFNLDPAMNLYAGLFTDTDDLPGGTSGGLAFGDDEIAHPGPWGDPRINFNILVTGDYTVRVFDYASGSGAPFDYEITLRGATPANVPEPGIVGLMGLGLAGLALSRRRA